MKKNKKIDLVKIKGSVRQIVGKNHLLDDIVKKLQSYGNIEKLKDDKYFLEHVCSLVQNAETVELTDEEKNDVVLEVITTYFPILNNDKDKEIIKADIKYLRSKKIVKDVSLLKKISRSAYGWIKKKFL